MFEYLINLLRVLWKFVRGRTEVFTYKTDKEYQCIHGKESDNDQDSLTIELECVEYKNIIKYIDLFNVKRNIYHYYVYIKIIRNTGEVVPFPSLSFPLLCSKIFIGSQYPHYCATLAALDVIIKMNINDFIRIDE